MKKALVLLTILLTLQGASAMDGTPTPKDPASQAAPKAGTILSELVHVSEHYDAGTRYRFSAYLSSQAPVQGGAFYLILESDATKKASTCEAFCREGLCPDGLFLFVYNGGQRMRHEGLTVRGMRAVEFDEYGPDFIGCIVHELLPVAERAFGVEVSPDPELHFVTGSSSGGLLAWNALWFHNDFFRRGWLSSPTFSAMRGGEEPMFLIRKAEPRPMRLFMSCGTNEPDYFFGDSFYAACNAKSAFACAGYDCKFEIYPNGNHSHRYLEPALFRRALAYVWQGWRDGAKTPKAAGSVRYRTLVGDLPSWEKTDEPMPAIRHDALATPYGEYTFKGGSIFLKTPDGQTRLCADDREEITAIALSVTQEQLYVADARRRFIYAYKLADDGTFTGCHKHAPLCLAHDCRDIGAADLCIGMDDRLFAATELGVQAICSFGLADIVLPLPNDAPAALWFLPV